MNYNIESECILPTYETGDLLYAEELMAMFEFLKSIETRNMECKILYWVKRKTRNFVIWENRMFRRTAYGLPTIAAISS